jgi:outer membrane lipoprotein SlyB
MATSANEEPIREAVGIFFSAEHLRDAIKELLASGCKAEELGLLASEAVVERSLGDLYARTNRNPDSPRAPAIAFIGKESNGQAASALGGGLFFVGTSGAMGAVVASSAVLGGALLAAIGGVVAVGLVGALVARVIHQSDAEFLQEHVDDGHILLFVRLTDATREEQVLAILTRQSGTDVKMYEVPVVAEQPPTAPLAPLAVWPDSVSQRIF